MSFHKDANIQFTTFSKDMSRFAYNRFLAIIGLLFVITSGLFLLVSYWLLTGSEYVENIMDNIGFQFDYINIKNSIYEQVGLIKEKLSLYMCGSSKNIVIKEEQLPDVLESYISSDNDSDNDVEDITHIMMELRKPPTPIDLTRSDDSDDNSSSSIEYNNTSDEDYVDENSDEEYVDDENDTNDDTNNDTNDDTNNDTNNDTNDDEE